MLGNLSFSPVNLRAPCSVCIQKKPRKSKQNDTNKEKKWNERKERKKKQVKQILLQYASNEKEKLKHTERTGQDWLLSHNFSISNIHVLIGAVIHISSVLSNVIFFSTFLRFPRSVSPSFTIFRPFSMDVKPVAITKCKKR